jgi:hypothetical protein
MKKLLIPAIAVAVATVAYARSEYLPTFDAVYNASGTKLDSCTTCHYADNTRNPYGADVGTRLAAGFTPLNAVVAVGPLDSDGDTFANQVEARLRTWPGDATDFPALLDIDFVSLSVPATAVVRKPITITAAMTNPGTVPGSATLSIVGTQSGVIVSKNTSIVYLNPGASTSVTYGFTPTAKGEILWIAQIADADADIDDVTASTIVIRK